MSPGSRPLVALALALCAACTELARDDATTPVVPEPAPVVEAGCADPCTKLGAFRCSPDAATQQCVRLGGCLTWATLHECGDGGRCCRDAFDTVDAPSSAEIFVSFRVEILCGGPASDAAPCGGTFYVDGAAVLTCPEPGTAPAELSPGEFLPFAQLVTSAEVVDALDRGTGCSIAWGAGTSMVVTLKGQNIHARDVTGCSGGWLDALRAQLDALDAAHCRGTP